MKTNVEDVDTNEIEFSPEQMQYIKDKFNIELSNNKEVLAVRDGFVGINDKVWWHGEIGPEFVNVSTHYCNIRDYPEVYSIKEPKYRIVYDWQKLKNLRRRARLNLKIKLRKKVGY